MSATNRGAIRRESDFYKTPYDSIEKALDALGGFYGNEFLECCAGDGVIVRALRRNFEAININAIEIREEELENLVKSGADQIIIDDFLKFPGLDPDPNVIITNPPYSIAQEIIEHCFAVAPNAEVIMLLPQSFLSSKARKPFWDKHPLTQYYPLAERPSFGTSVKCVGYESQGQTCTWREFYPSEQDYPRTCPVCGSKVSVSKTDARDYAWFVWSKYREPLIKVI